MRTFAATLAMLLVLLPALEAPATDGAGQLMADAAAAFLASLSEEQSTLARFSLDDAERTNWHFVPRERRGLPLEKMSDDQRGKARALLQTGLSAEGLETAEQVRSLETVLFEMGDNPATRNTEWYFFSVFGEPGGERPWGWRYEGHHLSFNFTVVEGAPVAWAPSFFGANPAEVRSGPRRGFRALRREEDLGRALVVSLSPEQRERALVSSDAPREILSEAAPRVDPLSPAGLPVSSLDETQREQLETLLEVYLSRMDAELAAGYRAGLRSGGLDTLSFAWAGGLEPGDPHYYRIQGPAFLVEYDKTQNQANHVHTVWRDFEGDFGRDLLKEHYAEAHASAGHGHGAHTSR